MRVPPTVITASPKIHQECRVGGSHVASETQLNSDSMVLRVMGQSYRAISDDHDNRNRFLTARQLCGDESCSINLRAACKTRVMVAKEVG